MQQDTEQYPIEMRKHYCRITAIHKSQIIYVYNVIKRHYICL